MGYEQALEKAWAEFSGLAQKKQFSLRLLNDTYGIDPEARRILSESCNVPAKTHVSIILLHYLINKLKSKKSVETSGEWVDFNQLEGGEEYYPTFKKRTISHILKKYADRPDALLKITERFPAKAINKGDVGVVIYPFENVPIMITMWKADEEFAAEANILFDRSIPEILCTEDIVVLTEIITHSI